MRQLLLAVLFSFLAFYSSAGADSFTRNDPGFLQNHQTINEINFILYLIGREDFDESLYLLRHLDYDEPHLRDSVNYLAGWVMYRQKDLEASAERLLRVSDSSPVFSKSHFFGAYNLAHIGVYDKARAVLLDLQFDEAGMHQAMRNLQLGGVSLLERDYESYQQYADRFSGRYHVLAGQEQRLDEHYMQLQTERQPSPFVAGVLSGAVPGLGRIYAGKTAEGVVSLLYMAAFGFTTYDFYRDGGSGNALFIVSAGITSIFYFGNIVGSVTAARRINNEFRHEMDQRILFDMHIPLRNAFN